MPETVTTTRMFALLSDQGTAMSLTALCDRCVTTLANCTTARNTAAAEGDWNGHDFVDCTENEALSCQSCGRVVHAVVRIVYGWWGNDHIDGFELYVALRADGEMIGEAYRDYDVAVAHAAEAGYTISDALDIDGWGN